MRESAFSDAALTRAAALVCQAMLDSLPEPEDCVYEPSPELRARLRALIRKEKRAAVLHRWSRSAAAVILAALVAAGSWLAVDTEARAAFFSWVREVYEERVVYRFFGEPAADTLPAYRITWLPEGYEEVFVHDGEERYGALYQIGDDVLSGFGFEYFFAQDNTLTEMLLFNEENYIYKNIDINGIHTDFYEALVPTETNCLIWVDKTADIVFKLNGFLDESVMVHIAESIILTNSTK